MSDDPKKRGPADRKRVSLTQRWEVRYWTARFGCTARQLLAAVKAVGPMVKDVRKRLLALRRKRGK